VQTLRAKEIELQAERAALEAQIKKVVAVPPASCSLFLMVTSYYGHL
jgi:hypothetical protein